MNVKISIELTERQAEFVERLVGQGSYASASEIMQEHVRDLMLAEGGGGDEQDPLLAMKDEIRRRVATPDDQWITMDENDDMFERLEERLRAKFGSPER